ncbi:TetR/AcrR family transcriptional regulator [Microbispora bryophytorum]|uniref:TetR/AcrR family transcriptional regulator n=1 Tax=Microbispora bryophytorum subsp. camponoti TaxID=1677852 RepID=A0ABR8L7R1_9ACTN|nr:TetR/AcrR family transcriptional regulator [Microbispora camponoti]MBD3144534.1 TetR/AcrR family transcriptional regulator [Microbispora camponoti]
MSRVSQAEAKLNRERVVAAASRLFREDGVVKVGIADVMQSIGLTQGGFYKQFASKDALVDEAAAKAFADNLQDLVALDHEAGGHQAAWQSLLESYFSVEHRDNPGTGCPAAGFAGDIAREPEHRETYARGVQELAGWIAPGDAGLAAYATLVGGILLARATAGTPLSEQILQAAHAAVARAADSGQPETG